MGSRWAARGGRVIETLEEVRPGKGGMSGSREGKD